MVTGLVNRVRLTLVNFNVDGKSFHVIGPQKLKADLPNSELTVDILKVGKLLFGNYSKKC